THLPLLLKSELIVIEETDISAEQPCLDDCLGSKFECLEAAECLLKRRPCCDDTVILQNDAVISSLKGLSDPPAEGDAAGQLVGCEANFAADISGLVEEASIRNLVDQAEGYKCGWVRMHDAAEVGAAQPDF